MATSSTTLPMAEQLVPDEVWAAIEPLLPPKRPHPKGGRPWIEDRAVLGGIIYVLRAGVPWRLLPAKELGCGSGVTCWRRLATGKPPAFGRPCIIGCWTGWVITARSTGPGRRSTA
jgi:transposase